MFYYQAKDPTPSPIREKHDKLDGHGKLLRQHSSGKERLASTNLEMTTPVAQTPSEQTFYDDAPEPDTPHLHKESYHTVVDHENIEIVIEPPPEEKETVNM